MSPDARELDGDWTRLNVGDFAVALACWTIAAAWIGAELAIALTPTPEPLVIYRDRPQPLTQWQCTKREFAEHRQACRDRVISELTKPKT